MTSSRNRSRATVLETEHYWRVSREGAERLKADIFDTELDDVRDEMEVLSLMTGSPLVRKLAQKYLERDARDRLSFIAAVA